MNLIVRRSHLLADAFQALSKLSAADAMKRLRVTFTGEQGVDSGGLGKEFFLLLSQQASLYMGPKLKGWMVAVAGEGKDGFFFCHSSNSTSTSSGDGSRNIGHHQLSAECIANLEGLPEFSEAAFIRFFGRLLGKVVSSLKPSSVYFYSRRSGLRRPLWIASSSMWRSRGLCCDTCWVAFSKTPMPALSLGRPGIQEPFTVT